ncbi:MAG: M6 family metalloprotease domain-containing protein, partial [Muribaculaceae bacterium]
MKKSILTLALAMSIAIPSALAKPALRNYVHRVEQPDGSIIELTRLGDEFNHVTLTTDNIPVLADTQGRYCYAILDANGNAVASDIQAANPAERTPEAAAFIASLNYEQVAEKILNRRESFTAPMRKSSASGVGLMESRFPHMGSPRALVLLVAFSDKPFTVNNAHDYFDQFLNGDTFTEYGGTGSVVNYFTTSSNGLFTPQFDVVGPLTLSNKTSYYGGNDSYGDDLRPCEMIREACTLANAEINFADYDTDGDGYVDNVYVIYAGQGEADYGEDNTIWPHSWKLSSGLGTAPTYDGVKVDDYGCGNEWGLDAPDGIGTFVHEFSHVLGLPDLYCTNYNSTATKLTPGAWDVLDYGPYNNEGRTPPTYSIYARNAMEWIDPIVITGESTIDLREIQEFNDGAVILTSDPYEFFLLENRQQVGWDAYVPGHGMLIWHIDYDASIFRSNTVNNSSSHQYVDIEEAGGTANNTMAYTLASYPFPGYKEVTSFTDDTKPSMVTWSGVRLNLPITNITENEGLISFDVAGGYVVLTAPVLASSAVTGNSFTISWAAVDKAMSYIVNVYTRDGSGNTVPVAGYSDFETTETSVTLSRLQSETQYFATVVAKRNNILSDVSDELSVTTAVAGFEEIVPIATAADNITSGSFTANWLPVNNAASYILYVTRSLTLPTVHDTVDFGS